MRLLQLFSLVLSLTLAAFASIAAPGHHLTSSGTKSIKAAKAMGLSIKDFLISDVYTQTLSIPATNTSNATSNTTISFVFTDLNSNTSTTCEDSWAQINTTNTTNTAPFSYVLCNRTNVTEFFQWKFTSYSGLDKFQMMFAHLFSDPIDFPPPFSVVEYFSSATNFSLACGSATGLNGCVLPVGKSPVHAVINAISG